MSLQDLINAVKHLPGKHPQKSHGRKGSSGIGPSTSARNRARNKKQYQKPLSDKLNGKAVSQSARDEYEKLRKRITSKDAYDTVQTFLYHNAHRLTDPMSSRYPIAQAAAQAKIVMGDAPTKELDRVQKLLRDADAGTDKYLAANQWYRGLLTSTEAAAATGLTEAQVVGED